MVAPLARMPAALLFVMDQMLQTSQTIVTLYLCTGFWFPPRHFLFKKHIVPIESGCSGDKMRSDKSRRQKNKISHYAWVAIHVTNVTMTFNDIQNFVISFWLDVDVDDMDVEIKVKVDVDLEIDVCSLSTFKSMSTSMLTPTPKPMLTMTPSAWWSPMLPFECDTSTLSVDSTLDLSHELGCVTLQICPQISGGCHACSGKIRFGLFRFLSSHSFCFILLPFISFISNKAKSNKTKRSWTKQNKTEWDIIAAMEESWPKQISTEVSALQSASEKQPREAVVVCSCEKCGYFSELPPVSLFLKPPPGVSIFSRYFLAHPLSQHTWQCTFIISSFWKLWLPPRKRYKNRLKPPCRTPHPDCDGGSWVFFVVQKK